MGLFGEANCGTGFAIHGSRTSDRKGAGAMNALNLEIWIPSLVGVGLVIFALLFAFVFACDRV